MPSAAAVLSDDGSGYASSSVNLLTEREALAKYCASGVEILCATTFAPGSRYEDFESSMDTVAEYGFFAAFARLTPAPPRTRARQRGAALRKAHHHVIGHVAKLWKGSSLY